MWAWISERAAALQAVMAALTFLVAALALVGIKWQIDASERLQQEQSARDIYREFLNLSISRPELAAPKDACAMTEDQNTAYESYVEYMLYTAEQAIRSDGSWKPVFAERLKGHESYVCALRDVSSYDADVQSLIGAFQSSACTGVRACTR